MVKPLFYKVNFVVGDRFRLSRRAFRFTGMAAGQYDVLRINV
jgi:hypothetical protein